MGHITFIHNKLQYFFFFFFFLITRQAGWPRFLMSGTGTVWNSRGVIYDANHTKITTFTAV
jgi:hypothetical protein